MLGASPHHGRQTLRIPLSFLMGIQLKITTGFLDSSEHLRRCRLLHNTLVSRDKLNQHPPRDTICCIQSNICIEQNIYFVHTDLILTRGQLSVALGILVLACLFEKRLYWPGTDECYHTVQHSSAMGLINIQVSATRYSPAHKRQ